MTLNRRVKRAGGIALLVGVALVTAMATPASAHGAGVTFGGESTIAEDAEPTFPLCLQTDDAVTITLFSTGTFNSGTAIVTHVAVFTADDPFYFGPGGTYSDSMCTTLAAVSGTLDVGTQGSVVNCEETTATYQRIGSLYTITTTAETLCDVHGGGQNNDNHTSTLTYTGIQLACGEPPFGVDCDPLGNQGESIEFTGTYAQSGSG